MDYLPGRPLRSRRETTIQHHLKVKTETVSQQELFLGRPRFHRYAAKFTRLHVQARSKRVERGEAANPPSRHQPWKKSHVHVELARSSKRYFHESSPNGKRCQVIFLFRFFFYFEKNVLFFQCFSDAVIEY